MSIICRVPRHRNFLDWKDPAWREGWCASLLFADRIASLLPSFTFLAYSCLTVSYGFGDRANLAILIVLCSARLCCYNNLNEISSSEVPWKWLLRVLFRPFRHHLRIWVRRIRTHNLCQRYSNNDATHERLPFHVWQVHSAKRQFSAPKTALPFIGWIQPEYGTDRK